MNISAIVCARPDGEQPGQSDFESVEKAAQSAGLRTYRMPISGTLGEGRIIRFYQAMQEVEGPLPGYRKSGTRAGSPYATLGR